MEGEREQEVAAAFGPATAAAAGWLGAGGGSDHCDDKEEREEEVERQRRRRRHGWNSAAVDMDGVTVVNCFATSRGRIGDDGRRLGLGMVS